MDLEDCEICKNPTQFYDDIKNFRYDNANDKTELRLYQHARHLQWLLDEYEETSYYKSKGHAKGELEYAEEQLKHIRTIREDYTKLRSKLFDELNELINDKTPIRMIEKIIRDRNFLTNVTIKPMLKNQGEYHELSFTMLSNGSFINYPPFYNTTWSMPVIRYPSGINYVLTLNNGWQEEPEPKSDEETISDDEDED